jgi:PTS system galactitol-specific IIA component
VRNNWLSSVGESFGGVMGFFDQSIALFPTEALTRDEALSELANVMEAKGLVKDDYLENVLKRELVYPTGLQIGEVGVAIPHTDNIYVNQSQIAFMKLFAPVEFIQMGTEDEPVSVQLIFMLALKEPHEQVEMLAKLIGTFQNPEVLAELLVVKNEPDYMKIIQEVGLR